MCKFKSFIVLFVFFVSTPHISNTQVLDEDECFTPNDNLKGTCINLKKCDSFVKLLTRFPRPPSVLQLLRDSQCGYEGLDPKVCCPPSNVPDSPVTPVVTPATPVTPAVTPPTPVTSATTERSKNIDRSYPYYREHPPYIENHPNLNVLPRNCGNIEDDKAIGGNKTGVFEFPWMALLAYRTGGRTRFMCGGTIITPKYILTAAHCVTNLGKRVLAGVRVGEHDISKEEDCEPSIPTEICAPPYQDLGVETIFTHPEYVGGRGKSARFQHDIGLVRLSSSIDMTQDNIGPVCLPITTNLQELQTDGLKMTMTGWGATETSVSSPDLLKIVIPVVRNIECGRILNGSVGDGIGFRQMCAGGVLNVDACGGDSGGPLQYLATLNGILRYIEFGVVSFGSTNCGKQGVPGVYTRIAHYMDWILDNLAP